MCKSPTKHWFLRGVWHLGKGCLGYIYIYHSEINPFVFTICDAEFHCVDEIPDDITFCYLLPNKSKEVLTMVHPPK